MYIERGTHILPALKMFNEIPALITWRGGSGTFSPLISSEIKDLTICSKFSVKVYLTSEAVFAVGGIALHQTLLQAYKEAI